MRKLFILALAAVLVIAFAVCGSGGPAVAAEASESSGPAAASGVDSSAAAAGWTVKVGDTSITNADVSPLVLVTQKLKKVSKDGSMKDQECKGYTVKSVLELAKIADFTKITAVAADGAEYAMTSEIALLQTTMLVLKLDGEDCAIPRLAIDGEGSKAWLKDVVELKIEK